MNFLNEFVLLLKARYPIIYIVTNEEERIEYLVNYCAKKYVTRTYYSWDFVDGNTSTQQAPTHTYAQLGNYNICLTITSIGGGMTCTSVYCDSVAVDTNMLRSSGFTIQVVTEADMLSNTKELTKNTNFSFYPNPVKDKLYIDFNGTSGKPILELLDMSGKRIMKAEINRENNFFNVHDIPSGMYIIKINTVDKQIRNKLMKN